MPHQLDPRDRDLLAELRENTAAGGGPEVCGLWWPAERRARVTGESPLVRLGLCTAEMTRHCNRWTPARERSAGLHRDPLPQSPHPHVRLTPAGIQAATGELGRREAIDRNNAVRRAVVQWLTAHPQGQLGGAEPANFLSSRYVGVAGAAVSGQELDQAVAWLQRGGFVTDEPQQPSGVRRITLTHKGMISGEQHDGDVTGNSNGP